MGCSQFSPCPAIGQMWKTSEVFFNQWIGLWSSLLNRRSWHFGSWNRQVPGTSETRSVQVSYREYVFSVEFAALDYTSPEKCQYAYKLEGFDRDWRYGGARRAAFYTNLDGGHYLFRVRGSNSDGVWSSHEANLAIDVFPPPWKRTWFIVLAAMLVLGALAWAVSCACGAGDILQAIDRVAGGRKKAHCRGIA